MNKPTPKSLKFLSAFVVVLFILAQFVITTTGNMGPWCFPSLEAPQQQGHPRYQFVDYGFPLSLFEVLQDNCFEPGKITYDWVPLGVGVDGFLLILVAAPLWRVFLKKKPAHMDNSAV